MLCAELGPARTTNLVKMAGLYRLLAELDIFWCCAASTPLFLYTPKGTGSHNLQFAYNETAYTLSPLLAPGQTKLQIDASDETNPLISFDSTASPQGQSGAITVCESCHYSHWAHWTG